MEDLPEHARRNREDWNLQAGAWYEWAREKWAQEDIDWGIWATPEADVGALGELEGIDVIELGCGTGYFSAWMARRGARVVGVDVAENQLATAASMQQEFGIEFPLHHASAEAVPLPDGSFDLAVSEYGAAIWCEPRAWIAEAARLLRPGGRLVFLANSPLSMLCAPDGDEPLTETLLRDYDALGQMEWSDQIATNFCFPHSETIRVLRECGFDVEALHELRARDGDPDEFRHFMTRGWAARWAAEDLWVARRAAR